MRDERRRIQLNLILDISRFLLFTSFVNAQFRYDGSEARFSASRLAGMTSRTGALSSKAARRGQPLAAVSYQQLFAGVRERVRAYHRRRTSAAAAASEARPVQDQRSN